MTIDSFSKTVRSVDLGFLSKERENDAFFSTGPRVGDALCKTPKSTVPSRSRKKVTKVTHVRISGRLKGKVKFSWRLLRNVRFPGAIEFPPKYQARRR